MPDGKDTRIVFVPGDKNRGRLALLCTDTALADEEIIRLYGKRWDIEVFFKMCKQHLRGAKIGPVWRNPGLGCICELYPYPSQLLSMSDWI